VRRREFIAGLGGAAAWPLVARAQLPSRSTIGLLNGGSPEDNVGSVVAFVGALTEAGYVEGKNLAIEYRWARGDYNLLSVMAADLAGRQVSVIAAFGTNAAKPPSKLRHTK
jgi:putative tryptophan/tyrosine transport system substrate-binding protein